MITRVDVIAYAILLVILVALSAFFSSSETAYMRANRFRIRRLAEGGNAGARRVEEILKEPGRLISTILLGNNFVNILASAIATALFISLFGEQGILYATIAMTVILLIFGEIIPKTIAAYRPYGVAMLFSRLIKLIITLLYPLVHVISLAAQVFLALFGVKKDKLEDLTEEDVGSVISMGHKEGFIPETKAKMLIGIMDMDSVPVRKIMLPMNEMVFISLASSFEDVVKTVTTRNHSRYPVYKDRRDNIVGYLHIRDMWPFIEKRREFKVRECMREAHFVPETKSILTQLIDFQNMHLHMAFVVDEYGTVKGGITLEDIIEEITGDIADEHDIIRPPLVPVSGKSFIVTGSMGLLDLERSLGREFPADYDTLSGLIYAQLDRIPEEGDSVTFEDMQFRIERMRGNRIVRVRVTMGE
ncbi:MAG TPA: CNNM domain-containing protein [Deltaproteobacteria bacterium]|nr:CNNM domain-containing protein [Deltaproteobacteria bacterium]